MLGDVSRSEPPGKFVQVLGVGSGKTLPPLMKTSQVPNDMRRFNQNGGLAGTQPPAKREPLR